jgi:hypothetical protein
VNKIVYEVDVIGHEAPFRWKLYRKTGAGARSLMTGASGEADTFQDACFAGQERAKHVEHSRVFDSTIEKVVVLVVEDVPVEREEDDELLVAEKPIPLASPQEFSD